MRHYIAVIHKDENSTFGVHFPDIPGCFLAADNLEQVIPNAIEAISLFGEDNVLPSPRSLAAIREDPSVRKDIAEGATMIGVPYVRDSSGV